MVLVEESALSLQRIYTSVTQVLASVPYLVKTQPTHLTNSYTSVTHLDPTRRKQRVSTFGTDSQIISEHECYTWTRLVRSSECLHLEPTHLKLSITEPSRSKC